ncbi:MAG: hypothetical protein LBV70_05075 [Candidatus Adiutrix sp.]|jgi:hypothetical protein|nr:hypothetical protein [Candidatus Adiutrix sp.]
MLVNPEISAILNRLSKSDPEAAKNGPRITRGEKTGKGGLDKPKDVLAYDHEETAEQKDEVDYLNERESKVSCYA